MKIVTADQMKEMDRRTAEEGYYTSVQLMQNAAEALYREVSAFMERQGLNRVVLLAGSGNNGGDAYALACLLHPAFQPAVLPVGEPRTPDCIFYYERCRELGVPFVSDISGFPLVVDGVFGVGYHGELPEAVRALFGTIGVPVIAIDLPSGMDADSGFSAPGALSPTLTVTFAHKKPCHLLADCGRVVLADIGMPKHYTQDITRFELEPTLSVRGECGHKNTYGTVGLVVGSAQYPGAAALALTGALQSGAGLVFGYLPRGPRAAAAAKFYGPVLRPPGAYRTLQCDSYLIGSGLGRKSAAGKRVRALWSSDRPLVVDGDGLWHLQRFLSPRKALTVLTPHMGEFARLAGVEKEKLLKNRLEIVEKFARKYQVILVLKDAATLVTDGRRTAILSAPCSALAKGGSGDLLAGLVAGLLAGAGEPFALVQTGVYLHNRAAHLSLREHSARAVQPEQIARYIEMAWMELEHGNL